MNTAPVEESTSVEIGGTVAEVSGLTAEEAARLVEQDERPTHCAQCRECSVSLTFSPTSSGAGFAVLNTTADPEVSFGVSASGLPMCPNGHGEMMLADESTPASDAISYVAERIAEQDAGPVQRSLPGAVPEFNYQGAYLELEAKAVEVDALHAQYTEDAETARESKKAWEKAAEVLQKMGLEFRRRRREKADGSAAALAPDAAVCRYVELNPGATCPLCSDPMWDRKSPPASEAHGVDARDRLENLQCIERLKGVPHVGLTVADLEQMKPDVRSELQCWAGDVEDHPDDRDRWMADGLPAGLGTPHKAGEPQGDGQQQNCTECGAFLGFEGEAVLAPGTLVGIDCEAGKPKARQPMKRHKTNASKRAAEKKAAAEGEAAAAPKKTKKRKAGA